MPATTPTPLGRPLLDKRNRASRVWVDWWKARNAALVDAIAAEASARIQGIADEANARIAELAAHVAAADPHPVYQKESEKNQASGYPGLSAASKLTGSQQVYGTAVDTACEGNDARLSNARTPVAHVHPLTDVTGLTDAWIPWSPLMYSDIGDEVATYSAANITVARYKLIGKTLIMQFRFDGTLNAVTPAVLIFSIPAVGNSLNAQTFGPAAVADNNIWETGQYRTDASVNILVYRPNYANFTASGVVGFMGLVVVELA